MRVLYFHQHFSTPHGSTGTRSYEMARRLIERGHQVTMVCGSLDAAATGLSGPYVDGMRRGMVDGIDVIELHLAYSNRDGLLKRTGTFLRFAWRSIRLARQEDHDLLFASSTPLTAGIPGIVMRCFRRTPFVFEVRDLWPELPVAMGVIRNPLVIWGMAVLEWASYRMASACIGLSPGIVKGIARHGMTPERIAMIPNGCDLDTFRPMTRSIDTTANREFRAVFMGTHGQANGLGAALAAARELKSRGRLDIKLVFIGDGKLKPQLVEVARQHDLTNCEFLAPLPKEQLGSFLDGMDAGMMLLANVPAFYYGTSPNKFFDYISAGLPVINNYPGWLADLIRANQCGLAFEPDDPVAFADALVYLADHPEDRLAMGQRGRRLAEQEFARDKLAARFVDVLESICENRAIQMPAAEPVALSTPGSHGG